MQRIRINSAIIALTAFVLVLTIASTAFTAVTFAAEDVNGNRIIFPVPGWKHTGPSPWLTARLTANYNLSGGCWNAYSTVPKTPHVLWANNPLTGGVIGGLNPRQGVYEEEASCQPWQGPLVACGRAIYVRQLGPGGHVGAYHELRCVDIETGETLWITPPLSGSNDGNYQWFNKPFKNGAEGASGSIVECIGTTVRWIDVATGQIGYTITFPRGIAWIAAGWNDTAGLTKVPTAQGQSSCELFAYGTAGVDYSRNYGYCYKFVDYDANVMTVPQLMWETPVAEGLGFDTLYEDVLVNHPWYTMEIFAVDRFTGKILWTVPFNSWQNQGGAGYGKYIIQGDDQYLYGFDIHTGEQVWRSEVGAGAYVPQHNHCIGNGKVFTQGFDGTARAFDAFTGKLLWSHYIGDCPYEPYKSWYGTWPSNQVPTAGIDAFIICTGDHVLWNPMIPGERFYVYNATTGKLMWSYPSAGGGGHNHLSPIPAEGMIFSCDAYTHKLFCFGKGPTSIEISVPKTQIAKGEYTWIYGKVLDASPGQPGTPCVSEADMGPWMEYLHSGMPQPPTKTGVSVTLYAEAYSTGTTTEIGTVTTDGERGAFATMWTPPTEDLYTLTAVFLGDTSYWDQYGSTTLAVGPAPAAASITSGQSTATITIATIAAVVIGAIAIQKRPFKNRREETEK